MEINLESNLENNFESAEKSEAKAKMKPNSLYSAIWRWHFYAGIFFAPLILILTFSGIIYLFKPQIENVIYHDQLFIKQESKVLSPEQLMKKTVSAYPISIITSYTPAPSKNTSTQLEIDQNGDVKTVFINQYNGKILGDRHDEDRLVNKVVKIHGELMAGKIGDRLVEMSACWAIILLITGIYLWWPRKKDKIMGILLPRFSKGKRVLLRDLHAVPAFWFSIFISIFIFTGLPWSGLLGDNINRLATSTHTSYPTGLYDGNIPSSVIPSKEVAKVPWAAEKLPVPTSNIIKAPSKSLSDIISIVDKAKVHKGYTITFPTDEAGVYTVSVIPPKPEDQATLHIDQYSGKKLMDLRFADYGISAKIIEIGIALHEGHYFGVANQIIDLIICLVLAFTTVLGLWMWWKRKPAGQLGSPTVPKDYKLAKGVIVLIILLAILLPLVGLSLLIALMLDFLIIRRISFLSKIFN